MGKPNQLGSEPGGGLGQDEELLQVAQARRADSAKLARRAAMNAGQLFQLGHAHRRLHVGQLQVVADVRVGVLVVVAAGQFAQLPVEALAAGVVLARARTSSRGPSRGRIRRASSAAGGR